jgi:hypothetical protein
MSRLKAGPVIFSRFHPFASIEFQGLQGGLVAAKYDSLAEASVHIFEVTVRMRRTNRSDRLKYTEQSEWYETLLTGC